MRSGVTDLCSGKRPMFIQILEWGSGCVEPEVIDEVPHAVNEALKLHVGCLVGARGGLRDGASRPRRPGDRLEVVGPDCLHRQLL